MKRSSEGKNCLQLANYAMTAVCGLLSGEEQELAEEHAHITYGGREGGTLNSGYDYIIQWVHER